MKIIFLNTNLALNTIYSNTGLLKLKNIINETKAQVVLFSDWRPSELEKNFIIEIFKSLNIPIIDLVLFFSGQETATWDNKNKDLLNKDLLIEKFVILDNREYVGPYSSRLVQITIKEGLTWENVLEAVNKLQEKRADFYVDFFMMNKDGKLITRQEIFSNEAAVYEFLNKNYLITRDIHWTFFPHQGTLGGNLYRGYAMVKQI